MAAPAPFFNPAVTCPLWGTFPPFFTLQPSDATRATQVEAWGRLLLAECASRRATLLSPLAEWPLWENRALQRALPADGIAAVAAHLVALGRAQWVDEQHVNLRVLFKTVPEWGVLVLAAVKRNGFVDDAKTLTEITEDLGRGEEFYQLDDSIMVEVLRHLSTQGHCQIVEGGTFGVIFKSELMSA